MSLDFNEFQAVRRRQKVDSNSVDKASARAEPEPLAPKPTPVDTVPGSGISARAGDFVELIEVQLLIVGLISRSVLELESQFHRVSRSLWFGFHFGSTSGILLRGSSFCTRIR